MGEAGRADTCFWEEGSHEAALPGPSEAEEGAGPSAGRVWVGGRRFCRRELAD